MNASSGSGSCSSAMEYQSLYTEIADTSKRIAGVLQVCVIGFTSVMAFIFSAKETEAIVPQMAFPGLLLLPSFIILMGLAQVRSSFITIVRTGTYILVFYEQHDPSISWQHRIRQLRETHLKSRALANSLWYVFLPLFLSSLVFSLLKLLLIAGVFDGGAATSDVSREGQRVSWERGIVVMFAIYTPVYVALFVTFLVTMKDLLRVWGTPYFKKMINCWIKLQKAETNEVLKERLTSENRDQVSAGCSSL